MHTCKHRETCIKCPPGPPLWKQICVFVDEGILMSETELKSLKSKIAESPLFALPLGAWILCGKNAKYC